jgi:hypothetical protein
VSGSEATGMGVKESAIVEAVAAITLDVNDCNEFHRGDSEIPALLLRVLVE